MGEIPGLECCRVILFGSTVFFLVVWGHAGCEHGKRKSVEPNDIYHLYYMLMGLELEYGRNTFVEPSRAININYPFKDKLCSPDQSLLQWSSLRVTRSVPLG